ncbi:MAG TPA: hypothetical protein DEP42_00565 [Ruminococcaceae bacterium]|nr:hypothetical protein [Oscillospiraceae bacterium]
MHTKHHHNPENIRAVSNRLARAAGHLESVRKMVDADEDCSKVLIQLAAIRSAINNAGKVLLKEHLNHCIVDAIQNGEQTAIDELNKAIDIFVK